MSTKQDVLEWLRWQRDDYARPHVMSLGSHASDDQHAAAMLDAAVKEISRLREGVNLAMDCTVEPDSQHRKELDDILRNLAAGRTWNGKEP